LYDVDGGVQGTVDATAIGGVAGSVGATAVVQQVI